MRNLEYLSPSSIAKFRKNLDEFYLTYLSENRAPRFPQDHPMSVGSAFDAYVKSYLHEKVFGKGYNPKFEFQTLFEAQVEKQNRDFALIAGKHVFDHYQKYGALSDLLVEIGKAVGTPRFEIEVKGVVNGYKEGVTKDVGNVTLLGKPDVFWINSEGLYVEFDWKVNGYMSKASPMPGFLRIRPTGAMHKDCFQMMHKGILINGVTTLDKQKPDWGEQLTIYGWLSGVPVGEDFVTAIDQVVCKNIDGNHNVEIRIAEHRLRVSSDYQWSLFAEIQQIWEIVHSKHVFREMSYEDNLKHMEYLDHRAAMLAAPVDENEAIFNAMTRQNRSW